VPTSGTVEANTRRAISGRSASPAKPIATAETTARSVTPVITIQIAIQRRVVSVPFCVGLVELFTRSPCACHD
jgi:hypothetical protein